MGRAMNCSYILLRVAVIGMWLSSAFFLFAQAPPQSFNYQAIVRDALGDEVTNQNVSFRISILRGNAMTQVYRETHNTMTNEFGIVNLAIGAGNNPEGDLSAIAWGEDEFYINIEVDPSGGTNYSLMGKQQLLSVPYALHAQTTNIPHTLLTGEDPVLLENFDGSFLTITGLSDTPPAGIYFVSISLSFSVPLEPEFEPIEFVEIGIFTDNVL